MATTLAQKFSERISINKNGKEVGIETVEKTGVEKRKGLRRSISAEALASMAQLSHG